MFARLDKWIKSASTKAADAAIDHITEDCDPKLDGLTKKLVEKTKQAVKDVVSSDIDWAGVGWDALKAAILGGGLIFGAKKLAEPPKVTRQELHEPVKQAPIIINNFYERRRTHVDDDQERF